MYAVTLRARTEQNPYIAELAAMAMAMRYLPCHLVDRQITIFTSNLGALLAASQPRHQSGQAKKGRQFNLPSIGPIPRVFRSKQEG
jgi:hypothetical protein